MKRASSVLALVVAAMLAGWWWRSSSDKPGVERDGRVQAISTRPANEGMGRVPLPAPSVRRALRPGAVAQRWLDESRSLQACADLLSRDEAALIAGERSIAASWPEMARARGQVFDAEAAERETRERIADRLEQRRMCQTLPQAEIASWWTLLERAALAGNPTAMEDYGHLVVRASANADDVFADIDEMARRKRLAYRFLREVAAQGNCMVSGSLERLAPNPTERYAFTLVSVEITRRFNDRLNPEATADNVRFMQTQADRAGARLDAGQAAESRRLAAQVIAACRNL